MQQALAAELNMQGIYDAVGDKIREIFNSADMGIRIYDPQTDFDPLPVHVRETGSGIAIAIRRRSTTRDLRTHVLRTRETLVINENMAQGGGEVWQLHVLPGERSWRNRRSTCRW